MGAASGKESPTPSQTLLAWMVLVSRSLRLCSPPSPVPPPPLRSPPRRAGQGRTAALPAPLPPAPKSTFHAAPRAASFPALSPPPCRRGSPLLPRALLRGGPTAFPAPRRQARPRGPPGTAAVTSAKCRGTGLLGTRRPQDAQRQLQGLERVRLAGNRRVPPRVRCSRERTRTR